MSVVKQIDNNRTIFQDGVPWENSVGYSRAVRVGFIIEVSGTTAIENGEVVGKNNPAQQTDVILRKMDNSLKELGATLKDVVRTRIYLTDIDDWLEIGRVHHRYFGSVLPATTMIEVNRLIDPNLLIEIEATAIISKKS